jgi:hypothetical protein
LADDSYIAGLKAAKDACWARCKRHTERAAELQNDAKAGLLRMVQATEAAGCAEGIGRLIAAREKEAAGG